MGITDRAWSTLIKKKLLKKNSYKVFMKIIHWKKNYFDSNERLNDGYKREKVYTSISGTFCTFT